MNDKCLKCGTVAELGQPSCDAEEADRFDGFMRFHRCAVAQAAGQPTEGGSK